MDNTNILFLQACYDGNDTLIKDTYLGKVDINFCDPSNGHGLYVAATQGHEATVKLLLQHGAIDSIVMGDSTSALHVATFKGFLSIVTLLLEEAKQPKVDLKNRYGETPLHYAAQQGLATITLKLLEHGADPDSCTTSQNTPLHYAAQRSRGGLITLPVENFDETCQNLLMASTQSDNLNKNKEGETFLTIAEKKGWLNKATLIQKNVLALKKLALESMQAPILNAFNLRKQQSIDIAEEQKLEHFKTNTPKNKTF